MNKILGATQTFELLQHLRTDIRESKERAEKLATDFRGRLAREHLRRQAAQEELSRSSAQALTGQQAAVESARASLEAKHAARKTWIGKAYRSSQERGVERVEHQVGGRRYELQKRMLQAERDRDSGIASNTATGKEFAANLRAEDEKLTHLEGRAQGSFRGYSRYLAGFLAAYNPSGGEIPKDHDALLSEVRSLNARSAEELDQFRQLHLVRAFRFPYLWVLLGIAPIALVAGMRGAGVDPLPVSLQVAGAVSVVLVILASVLRVVAEKRGWELAGAISQTLAGARRAQLAAKQTSERFFQGEHERLLKQFEETARAAEAELKRTQVKAGESRVACRMRMDEKAVRAGATNDGLLQKRLAELEANHQRALAELERRREERTRLQTEAFNANEQKLERELQAEWTEIETEWRGRLSPAYAALLESNAENARLFPSWSDPAWTHWQPPSELVGAARFAELDVDLPALVEGLPTDKRLRLPGPERFPAVLSVACPRDASLLLETGPTGHEEAIAALNSVILRLLATAPPGRLNFSIIDPVGLGQNFAGVMHLADYEEQIISNRIWTQSGQIEQKLADLNEHMEKVIQMYLRNEYATIAEYNERAGVIAEKYYFLVVADFPVNFTDVALKRLMSIAASGARCGVYMLLHWDQRQPTPPDFIPDELRKHCFCISRGKGSQWLLAGKALPGVGVQLDPPPPPEVATDLIRQVGEASRDSSRVEVPFEQVAPAEAEMWSQPTTNELRVPIGRTGATSFQYLAIGKGTCQHGLVAGKTGSGKSTLFHVIITNLALWSSPEAVEFYLVDFKKGVEFKCYADAKLPHARVVAIESDREFGLSVLQRVDEELQRRGDLFRKLGVQDLPGYKRAGGTESLPRSLLIIDEFQEFFVEDDKIAQTASLLLDRIVRQGRAFGIHVLLGSQTLGGAYTVARTTLGQMVIRIALQCNEADAYLIMDENNPAPRLLSRPGEGIYNDMAGALEGNSPFQVVWLPDRERNARLQQVRARADHSGRSYPAPVVFEGNVPADVRENPLLIAALAHPPTAAPSATRIWLGAPNSIKGPTEAALSRQSGSHLLVVAQSEESTLSILAVALLSLASQYPSGTARIYVFDSTAPESAQRRYLEDLVRAMPQTTKLARPGEVGEILAGLGAEMKERGSETETDAAAPVFLIFHGLQRFAKLRYEEEFAFATPDPDAPANPAVVLHDMVSDGARLGFHVLAMVDTYNNVTRFINRKALSEIGMRVLFQMSATDSASLIDSPKASTLGLHRALYSSEHEGYIETFRPYALPPADWMRKVLGDLKAP